MDPQSANLQKHLSKAEAMDMKQGVDYLFHYSVAQLTEKLNMHTF
jgi:hypothetical protein